MIRTCCERRDETTRKEARIEVTRTSRQLLLASLPAALIGVHALGAHIRAVPVEPRDAWQLALLDALGIDAASTGVVAAFATGTVFWLPLLIACLAVSFGWARLFAKSMGQPIDPGWLPVAWLFSLTLPATAPLGLTAIALSFGLIFGCHAFGGTGRYLVNPALLGIVFLGFGYPALTAPDAMLPGSQALSTWALVAMNGVDAARVQGVELVASFAGDELGAIGTPSAIACLAGAVYLVAVRAASAPIVAGGLLGLIGASAAGASLAWTWQLALGNFAFALAFLATDATTRPATLAGRWIYGALFGALTVVLRTANSAHPEGSWAALLLASLCIPLIDRIAMTIRPAEQAQPDA
jgi:Na+-transporting NADH:ubiquinone oxidoreductase subunit B